MFAIRKSGFVEINFFSCGKNINFGHPKIDPMRRLKMNVTSFCNVNIKNGKFNFKLLNWLVSFENTDFLF